MMNFIRNLEYYYRTILEIINAKMTDVSIIYLRLQQILVQKINLMKSGKVVLIMVASSSTSQTAIGKKKYIPSIGQKEQSYRGNGLHGINYDIQSFRSKFSGLSNICHIIESSRHEGTLIPKKSILNLISKYISRADKNVLIFYTGHGYENGNWAIQTYQEPEGASISLQQIIGIWKNHKPKHKQSHLFIFMDSCYSGSWCYQLNKLQENQISIISSCNKMELSTDYKGGIFYRCLLQDEKYFYVNHSKLQKQKQHPIFSCKGEQPAFLSEDTIRKLQQNIINAQICQFQRRIRPGLILQAKCQNQYCRSYQKMVRINKGINKYFNLGKQIHKSYCPLCSQRTEKAQKVSFYKALIQIEGLKQREDDIKKIIIRATDNKVHKFQLFNEQPWNYLEINTKSIA